MGELTITKEDINKARNYLIQYLSDGGYTGSAEDGTAVHDVLIKPLAILYTIFKAEVDYATAYLSLDRAQAMKSVLGTDEYDATVDAILSNWFVTRKEGTHTTGAVRLFFTRELEYLRVKPDDGALCEINGVQYAPTVDTVFSSSDFTSVFNTVGNTTEYYVDVPITSIDPTAVGAAVGDSVTCYLNDIYLLRGEVPSAFLPGTAKESSEAFIARTEEAINTRELISDRAIRTVLLDEFAQVVDIFIAGYGDSEQLRDIVEFATISVHVGNKADIYLQTALVKQVETVTVPSGGEIDLAALSWPVVDVVAVTIEDVAATYTISGIEGTDWGSVEHTALLTVDGITEDTAVEIAYLTNSVLPDVSEFIQSDRHRVVCYAPYVKHKFPVRLSFEVEVRVTADAPENVTDLVRDAIVAYTNARDCEDGFAISDVVKHVHTTVSGVASVHMPLTVTYDIFDPATLAVVSGAITDEFALPGEGALSDQVSVRTAQFYTDADHITVTEV